MRKLLLGAAGAALVMVLALAGVSYWGTAHADPGSVTFDLDPDISGNTASAIGPGGVEACVRCNVAVAKMGDGVADCMVDVIVFGASTVSRPIGYDSSLIYDHSKVVPVQWQKSTTLTADCGPGDEIACTVADGTIFTGEVYRLIQMGADTDPNKETITLVNVVGNTITVSPGNNHLNTDPVFAVLATNPLIKLGAVATDLSEALPDPGSPYTAGAANFAGGTAGNGALVRIGLDAVANGVVDFSFNAPPLVAYATIAEPGGTTVNRDTGQLAINTDCPALQVDLSVASAITAAPANLNVSENGTLTVTTTGTHTNAPLSDTVNATISHTVTAPADCTVNGGASASDSWTGNLAGGANQALVTNFTIHCSKPSTHVFGVVGQITLNTGGYTDPDLTNNRDPSPSGSIPVSVKVWAVSDIKITSFSVVYTRMIDSDGDTIPDLPVVDVSTPTNVIVRKVVHNNGPYGPTEVKLTKAATVLPYNPMASEDGCGAGTCANAKDDGAACDGTGTDGADMADTDCQVAPPASVSPPTDSEQRTLDVSVAQTVDETFTIHCADASVGKLAVLLFTNTVTIKDPHISDPSPATASTVFKALCIPRFTPTFKADIAADDGTMNPPMDDICIMGLPCKSLTQVIIPDDTPKQPLALIMTIWPAAIDIRNGLLTGNGSTVGQSSFSVTAHSQGMTPWACVASLPGVATQYDACLPPEIEPACPRASGLYAGLALFPGAGPPPAGTAFVQWAPQLDAILNYIAVAYPGSELWTHAVGVAAPGVLNIPINILTWKLALPVGHPLCPAGGCWLVIGQTGNPDNDLDGKWDDVVDPDDDNDGIPDGRPRDNPTPKAGICSYNPAASEDGCGAGTCGNATDDGPNCDGTGSDGADQADSECGRPAGCVDNCPVKANNNQLDTDGDQVGDVCDPNAGAPSLFDKPTFTCSPYQSDTISLGESMAPAGQTLRTCEQYGDHTVMAILIRADLGLPKILTDTITCITADTDLVVELIKNENITVPEDLSHTETVDVDITNGVGPTRVAVVLAQVSTDRNKCVSHLVKKAGDTLTEFTVGNQYYSKLTWEEPLMGASEHRVVSRDYNIVCSVPGSFPNIEQFVVDVEPLDMAELDPLSNTAENHVSIVSKADFDEDTVPNATDNCPYDKNPLQEQCGLELNPDGIGDICDPDDDNDGIPDVDDDCDCLPGIAGPHPNNGCPMSDVSIVVTKDETPEVQVSEDTAYPVTVTITNGGPAAQVDVDLLLVSPNPKDNDPVMDEGCIADWKDAQAGLSYVSAVIEDPDGHFTLHSMLSGTIAMTAGQVKVLNLTAYIHCFEKSLHTDAFELAAGAAPLPPVWDNDPGDNIAKNKPDVTAYAKADVKKVSFQVVSPPTSIDVGVPLDVTVEAVLHNNGTFAPVTVQDEINAIAPTGCTVTPNSRTNASISLPYNVDVMFDGVFTLHCSKPSTHKFTFTDKVTVLTEHVKDPVPGNNTASTSLTVNALAKADVKIIDQHFVGPWSEIDVSALVPVTLRKILHNNGALPVEVTVTKTATAPADCEITPPTDVEQVVLPPSVDVVKDEVFTIHCSKPSSHTFNVVNRVSGPEEPHIVDPDPSNNVASTDLTVAAILNVTKVILQKYAAVDAIWKALPAKWLAAPGVRPVKTDALDWSSHDVWIDETHTLAKVGGGACLVNGVVGPVSQKVNVFEPAGESRLVNPIAWNVTLPANVWCRYNLTVLKEPKLWLYPHVRFTPVEETSDLLLCADRDSLMPKTPADACPAVQKPSDTPCPGGSCPDGVADPGAAVNLECGPPDNCPDHYNPGQADSDGDGIGDACDDTPSHDVTVKSLLVFGPAPLNLSDTTGRYMWAVGEIGNLRNHVEVADLSLTITPSGIAGCLDSPKFLPQLILPGRNPFKLMACEQKWVLYRTRFECHAPALPGIYPLNITLCIDHLAHVPPSGDDLNLANDCQARIKSLLIQ